ncbi:MFS transporter [Prauserella cavernicola]|uniref:MFS transporter n=1 Tax=Prauserella cavernicola TaxID=2800127 RepID=A0A934QQQ2_9PSEU|nr:MFS transporter [Prauserella cavernicola]MBK1784381.1 MFS transporter [Prauserella cavernicola]
MSGGRASTREWVGLGVLLLPSLLVAMDLSVLFFALPFLSAELEPTSAQQLWVVDIYGFLLGGLLITMGSLGDRIGRRKLLLIGAVAFGAASLLSAYSQSAEMLIAARALLGIGGATIAPSTLSLIRNMFHDASQRTLAISLWTAAFAGGGVLGPIIGGFLLEHFWWGSVFLINLPAMALLLILGPLVLPEYKHPQPGRFDLLSAVLSLATVLPVINGVKRIAEHGADWFAIGSIVAGLALGLVFVARQRALEHPMIDVRLFRKGEFGASIVTAMFAIFAVMGLSLVSAQYLQIVLGMRPLEAALWSAPSFAGMAVGTTAAAVLARWVRPGIIIASGLVLAAGGFTLVLRVGVDSGLATIVVAMGLIAAGVGAVAALATDLVVASAPPERAGSASAMSETGTEFGGALGLAVLGSVGVAAYRSEFAENAPAGLPPEAAAAAQDTLGGAMAVAGQLPGETGAGVVETAHEAFVSGMHTTSVIGGLILAAVAVFAAVLLRKVRPTSAREEPAPTAA